MEKMVKEIPVGGKFIYNDKPYIKAYSTTAAVVPILYQVLAVEVNTGKIISLFERDIVTTVQ